MDLGSGDTAAQDRLCFGLPATDRQVFEHPQHFVEVGAGIDERPEGHVAGDSREAVEPGGGHE